MGNGPRWGMGQRGIRSLTRIQAQRLTHTVPSQFLLPQSLEEAVLSLRLPDSERSSMKANCPGSRGTWVLDQAGLPKGPSASPSLP